MTALTVTIECSDGEPLTDERRDEIRAAFMGAGKRIGMDVQAVHVEGGNPRTPWGSAAWIRGLAEARARGEFGKPSAPPVNPSNTLTRGEAPNRASARTLADRAPHSVTEWHYEQASWDKRHGRV